MKNIAFIHNDFPAGGAERVTFNVIEYFSGKHLPYNFFVITKRLLEDRYTDKIRNSVNVITVKENAADKYPYETEMGTVIRENRIDALVCASVWDEKIDRLAHDNGCRLIYANHGKPFWEEYYFLDEMERNSRSSVLKRIEWIAFRKFKYSVLGKARRKAIELYRYRYNKADFYTVLCQDYKREICSALGIDENKSRIKVIHNQAYCRENINLDKEKEIIFVGRLSRFDKRVDRLLKIWAKVQRALPDYRLTIIGNGPEMETLTRMSRKLKLERISFEGLSNDVGKYYQRASFLVLTSTHEGWPLCISEALSFGVIPVAFNCSAGVKELLSDDCGFLVKPFSLGAFARTLYRVATTREEELIEIRKKGIKKTLDYNSDSIGKEWEALFSLCGK